jgi:hypothetical protein
MAAMSEQTATTAPADNLIARLVRVMEEVGHVPKRGFNKHFKYQYVTEQDIGDACRAALGRHGVLFVPDMEEAYTLDTGMALKEGGKTSFITRAKIRCHLYNADDMSEHISFVVFADGMDNQDKGCYKALTGGVKYGLMKMLLISTGDDPERDNDDGDRQADRGAESGNGDGNRVITCDGKKFHRYTALGKMEDMLHEITYGCAEDHPKVLKAATGFSDLDTIPDDQILAAGEKLKARHQQWQDDRDAAHAAGANTPPEPVEDGLPPAQEDLPF